jgi:hypothetical protein
VKKENVLQFLNLSVKYYLEHDYESAA